MRKNRYTLMELLTVAAIIAILAGLAIPGVNIARRRARENAALAEVHAINNAMKHFESEYGEGNYPTPTGYTWAEGTPLSDDTTDYDNFFAMLTGFSVDGNKTAVTGTGWGNNKKHIKYLDPRADGGKFNFNDGSYTAMYLIYTDVDGDGKITTPLGDILAKTAVCVKLDQNQNRYATSWGGIIQKR